MSQRSSTSGNDLSAALLTFAVFSWELVVVLIADPLLAATAQSGLWHHLITAAGWAIGAFLLFRHAKRVGLVVEHRRATGGRATGALASAAVRAVLVVAAITTAIALRAAAFGELKVIGELETVANRGGVDALADGLGLTVYYLSEAFLIVLLILFAQRAGGSRFGHAMLPWGGLTLALTWGVMHFFLQGPAAGFYAMFAAVLYGVIVVFGPRSIWAIWSFVAIAFIV